jgi:hypothetical protein
LLPVDAQVREGVLLCALAPGGASATLIAARMRADAAVAAAVVIATTATSVVLTPLLVAGVLGGGDASTMFAVAGRAGLTALTYQALPLALGVLVRRVHPRFAARLLPWTSRIANAALAILVVGLLATRGADSACAFLRDHFRRISTRLGSQADVAGGLGHASSVGRLREGFVHQFLRPHLPRTMDIRSGIILDSNGARSTQQDCIIIDAQFPLVDVGSDSDALILAESVLATIEIKSFLSGDQLKETLAKNNIVRKLRRVGSQIYEKGGARVLLTVPNPIIQYVLAFNGLEVSTLAEHIKEYAMQQEDGGVAPDAICVLGRGVVLRSSFMPVKVGDTIMLPRTRDTELTYRPLRQDALYAFYRRLLDDIVPLRMANWELDAYYSEEKLS